MIKNRAKRSILLVLALLMVASMSCFMGFAAEASRVDGFSGGGPSLATLFSLGQAGDPDNMEVRAGDEIRIPLTADMFTWSDGRIPIPMTALTTGDLRGVRVGTRVQAGRIALDYVQFDTDVFSGTPFFVSGTFNPTGRTAYISIMLAEELVSLEDQPFSFDVFLRANGEEIVLFTVSGTMVVDVVTFSGDGSEVAIFDGSVAEAEDPSKNVVFDLGNGLTLKKNTTVGKRYYGTCQIKYPYDPGFEEDFAEAFPIIYPSLEFVYQLHTINMRAGAVSKVTIVPPDDDPVVYHVYGDDMSYLGTTKEELPYSDYYFMTTELIPTFEMQPYEDDLSKVPNWDVANLDNGNDNPSTGR